MKVVAIHQPNFFPWLGWFDKVSRADIFVLMDSVQVQLTGGNYTNRVQLLVAGKPAWITMPLARGYTARSKILNAPLAQGLNWRRKIESTIRQSYARAPFFHTVMPFLEPILRNPAETLGGYNVPALLAIARMLGLDTSRIVMSSDFAASGRSTELLVKLVQMAGGTAYLTGGGASYQDDEQFSAASIEVVRQNFVHPVYNQQGLSDFVPGLSVIDALMNVGFAGTANLLGVTDNSVAESCVQSS